MSTNTSTAQMHERIASYKSQINTMSEFASRFGESLPFGVASLTLDTYNNKPNCLIRTGYTPQDRIKSLALCGEVFGPGGWTKQINHDKTFWNWTRNINGVDIIIYQAEQIPLESDNQPVPPSAFPLLLKEDAA